VDADAAGREAEINPVLRALASPVRGRVVLIGPRRVGKSAMARAVAEHVRAIDDRMGGRHGRRLGRL